MIQVQISDIERIDHYEEIAIDRVQKLLDGSGRDSDKAACAFGEDGGGGKSIGRCLPFS